MTDENGCLYVTWKMATVFFAGCIVIIVAACWTLLGEIKDSEYRLVRKDVFEYRMGGLDKQMDNLMVNYVARLEKEIESFELKVGKLESYIKELETKMNALERSGK